MCKSRKAKQHVFMPQNENPGIGQGRRIHEARSLCDAWSLVERYPGSFLVVELTTANAEALLGRIATFQRDFPWACLAVVAERSLVDYEWLARELGAVWFATSLRELAPIARLARRHVERAPAPRGDVAERIFSGLPWAM